MKTRRQKSSKACSPKMSFLEVSCVPMLSRSQKFGQYPQTTWAHCAFATIRSSIALLVLVLLLQPSLTLAAAADQDTVLTDSRQRIEKLDYRVTGRLTKVEGDGKRTNYRLAAKARWLPDGL